MWQYHLVVNMDKREYLEGDMDFSDYGFAYQHDQITKKIHYLLANDWKGDRVYILNQLAYTDDLESRHYYNTLKQLEDEFGATKKNKLYRIIKTDFKRIDTQEMECKYLYNHKTKEYVDFSNNLPLFQYYVKDGILFGYSYSPTTLLLNIGNELSQLKFCYNNEKQRNLVGRWVPYSQYIEPVNAKLDLDYRELIPNFAKWNDHCISKNIYKNVMMRREYNRELFLQEIEGLLNYAIPVMSKEFYSTNPLLRDIESRLTRCFIKLNSKELLPEYERGSYRECKRVIKQISKNLEDIFVEKKLSKDKDRQQEIINECYNYVKNNVVPYTDPRP